MRESQFTTRFTIIFAICFLLVLFYFSQPTPAYFDGLPDNRLSTTFSLQGQASDQSSALTIFQPLKAVNGHWGVFTQRQVGNGEVISEILAAEVQGGFDIGKVQIRGLIETERDIHRGIGFSRKFSYFAATPDLPIGEAVAQFGAGNSTENVEILETIQKGPAETSFNWLAFADVRYKNITAGVQFEPGLGLKSLEAEANLGITHALDANFAIGASLLSRYNSDPFAGGKVNHQYTLFARWTR